MKVMNLRNINEKQKYFWRYTYEQQKRMRSNRQHKCSADHRNRLYSKFHRSNGLHNYIPVNCLSYAQYESGKRPGSIQQAGFPLSYLLTRQYRTALFSFSAQKAVLRKHAAQLFIVFVLQFCNCFYFNKYILRKLLYSNTGSCRKACKILCIHCIKCRKVFHILKEACCLYYFFK